MATALRPSPTPLADPKLRAALTAMVRRRVPPADVDDVVQATLTDALSSTHRPDDDEALRQWVHGIARHKIADLHRRRGREPIVTDDAACEAAASMHEEPVHDANDLLRWAEKEAPEQPTARRTLDWMMREADGEKLETIARDAKLPAPQVRQRVARMRRHFRARWAAQLAAVAALLTVALVVWMLRRPPLASPRATHELFDPIAREAGNTLKNVLRAPPPAPAPAPAPTPTPAPSAAPAPTPAPPPTKKPPKTTSTASPWAGDLTPGFEK